MGKKILRRKSFKHKSGKTLNVEEKSLTYKVSSHGDLIVVEYKEYSFLFFLYQSLTFEELKDVGAFLFPAFSKTQNLISQSISGRCNWKDLNDDLFEELCYDILYCHPNFDSTTIQKMGKSRSRDGGRDILIKTKKTATAESVQFIFQCKFLDQTTSLTAAKIPGAANVIIQFGAKGYGVFTSGIIDATLYDMLDGFNRNLKINTSYNWSKYELERYINTNLPLKEKYFSNSKQPENKNIPNSPK